MKLPSKVTPYKESSIAKFPAVLSILEDADMSSSELFSRLKKSKVKDIEEYVEILDALYALGKIEIRGELLHYVG